MSILIRHVFSRLGGLATQERRTRILACDQTHGDPDASESNQEAVSHSNWLCPEKLWQVEHKPQGERNATPQSPPEWHQLPATGVPQRTRWLLVQDGRYRPGSGAQSCAADVTGSRRRCQSVSPAHRLSPQLPVLPAFAPPAVRPVQFQGLDTGQAAR